MTAIGKVDLTGVSGLKYTFDIYSLDSIFNNICAIYIFANLNILNQITPIYIGETTELGKRLTNHEKQFCAIAHNVNCFCIYPVNPMLRFQVETDLINAYPNCPCNKQP